MATKKTKKTEEEVVETAETTVQEEPQYKNHQKAYVSFLSTNNFMPAIVGLLGSYARVSKGIPFVVMVSQEITDVNRRIIEAMGAMVVETPKIQLPYTQDEIGNGKTYPVFDKLNIFCLSGVDKMVYIDSDILFIRNCDELFDCQPLAMGFDAWSDDAFNNGVMVCEPNRQIYDDCINIIHTQYEQNHRIFFDDQGVLNEYFFDEWKNRPELQLDKYYNYQLRYTTAYKPAEEFLKAFTNIKLLHMTGRMPKPWLIPSLMYFIYYGGITYAAWMEQYMEMLNGYIAEIQSMGFDSPDLKITSLSMDYTVWNEPYPRQYKFEPTAVKKEDN